MPFVIVNFVSLLLSRKFADNAETAYLTELTLTKQDHCNWPVQLMML